MNVAFIGHGYVGLVTAAVFAEVGNTVWVVGRTKEKIDKLNAGIAPFYEPGLAEMLKRNVDAGRLKFTVDYKEAVEPSKIIFICVGTPTTPSTGEADLTQVFASATEIGKHLDGYKVVSVKSTVPPGTNKKVGEILGRVKKESATFGLASVPEFLREGSALSDTLHPDRYVIGTETNEARDLVLEVHKSIDGKAVTCNIETAELIKYASNAMLATKISFGNAIAILSEKVGADVEKVLEGVGLDRRIGRNFLYPGVGYGGSCFPKDVKALIAIAKQFGYDFELLRAVETINKSMRSLFVEKVKQQVGDTKGKTIALLGVAFKPDTDDMREAPSIDIAKQLLALGMHVVAYDPIAMEVAASVMSSEVVFAKTAIQAATNADVIAIITEWKEFRELDLEALGKVMKNKIIIDGRNMFDPEKVQSAGFTYVGMGRG